MTKCAGERKNDTDARFAWPEMLIFVNCRPTPSTLLCFIAPPTPTPTTLLRLRQHLTSTCTLPVWFFLSQHPSWKTRRLQTLSYQQTHDYIGRYRPPITGSGWYTRYRLFQRLIKKIWIYGQSRSHLLPTIHLEGKLETKMARILEIHKPISRYNWQYL